MIKIRRCLSNYGGDKALLFASFVYLVLLVASFFFVVGIFFKWLLFGVGVVLLAWLIRDAFFFGPGFLVVK